MIMIFVARVYNVKNLFHVIVLQIMRETCHLNVKQVFTLGIIKLFSENTLMKFMNTQPTKVDLKSTMVESLRSKSCRDLNLGPLAH